MKKSKRRELFWTGNAAYRDKGELFAYIRYFSSVNKWHVLTTDFNTTNIPCDSRAEAVTCIEGIYACEG